MKHSKVRDFLPQSARFVLYKLTKIRPQSATTQSAGFMCSLQIKVVLSKKEKTMIDLELSHGLIGCSIHAY